jgi:hypothetical protein
VDIEWLLSTLFDASLLYLEPPATAAPFYFVPKRVNGTRSAPAHDAAHLNQSADKIVREFKTLARNWTASRR